MSNRFLVCQLFFFLPVLVFAQETQKSKWSGTAGIGGSYYRGNVNKMDIRTDATISHADSVFENSVFYRITYSEYNFVKNNQEFSAGTKFDWRPKDKITPFFVLAAYKNEFNGYHLRLSAFTGVKYSFIDIPVADYSLSLAIQYDAEKYTAPKKSYDIQKPDKEIIRLSFRPKIKQKIGESVNFEHISFIRPKLNDFSNIQSESQTILSNKLTESLSLNIVYEFNFDSNPPSSSILKTNNSLIFSLRIKL